VTQAARTQPERVPRVAWADALNLFTGEHKLGEHVALEGPNGSGKSLLALELLKVRGKRGTVAGRPTQVTVLAVKPRDKTLSSLGWKRITSLKDWPPAYGDEHSIVWPVYGSAATVADRQAGIFREVLLEIMESGNQIVYIDETAYFEEPRPNGLGLARLLNQFWYMSRSNGVTLMAGTQRPRRVSRSMWSEPYWLFLFRPEDEDDLKRVAQLSGFKQLVLDVVPNLGTHEFLLLRRRPEPRVALISQVEI
jgi:hypothetical protein